MKQFFFIAVMICLSFFVYCQPYPAVSDIKAPPLFNEQLRYTSSLLKDPGAPIRILVYGQSISVQAWWKDVKTYFEKKYPHANISFTNKAIGGFSAERLKLTVANDVASLYPDLILFHDYGNEEDYENIIRIIRNKTTADIAIQTDHIAQQNQEWHDRHSNVWLPALCKKYGLALIDVRKYWKIYLQENKLEIRDLLSDGVHLNDQGNYLMAAIIKKYFDHLSFLPAKDSGIIRLRRGRDFLVRGSSLQVSFTGNRIDVKSNRESKDANVDITLDGQVFKNDVGCFYYTRPLLHTGGNFLSHMGWLLAMELSAKVQEEHWSLTILSVDSTRQQVQYSIKGSMTGEDGTGNSNTLFTSNSGRVTIRPEYWFMRKSKGDFAQFHWLKPGDVLQWQIKAMCYNSLVLKSPGRQTLFQGIRNTKHQLKISGPGVKHINELIVYMPLLKDE